MVILFLLLCNGINLYENTTAYLCCFQFVEMLFTLYQAKQEKEDIQR